jgi:hypothetical protein
MKKKLLYIGIIASISLWSCKPEDEFDGPSLNDLYGSFAIVEGLDISNRSVDFGAGQSTFFTAAFTKNVDWTLRIKGLTSGAQKEISGFSNALTSANALWNGSTSLLPMFRAEECAVELTFSNEPEVLRDTLQAVSGRPLQGFVLSDFESGINPGWDSFAQSGANMSFAIANTGLAAQGTHYFDIGGTVNWDWLIGLINMPASAYGGSTYPLSSNPQNVYFNTMLYNPPAQTNGLMLFQFREDDNGDGTYSDNVEDMYSIQVNLADTGWQQISSRYADLATLINGQPAAALGNGLHEPHKLIRVSVLFLANPTSGYANSYLDYLTFTENGPLEP